MIIWRAPLPSRVFHAFDVPDAAKGKGGQRGRRRGGSYRSLCGEREIRFVSSKFRTPEVLNQCDTCAAIREQLSHTKPQSHKAKG